MKRVLCERAQHLENVDNCEYTPDENSEYCSDNRETADKEQLPVGDVTATSTEYGHSSDSSILYCAQLSASSLPRAPAAAAAAAV